MRGAAPVNNEFEVGFNSGFESSWYRVELVGRCVMIGIVGCALFGLLGRGPYSHRTITSERGEMKIEYEPIARHSTHTAITVHLSNPTDKKMPVHLMLGQHLVERMGFQKAMPQPDSTSAGKDGIRLGFVALPHQQDVLIRFEFAPSAVGLIPVQITDGDDTARWKIMVLP